MNKYYNLSLVLTRWLGVSLLVYAALDLIGAGAIFYLLQGASPGFLKSTDYLGYQSLLMGPLRIVVGLALIAFAKPVARFLCSSTQAD